MGIGRRANAPPVHLIGRAKHDEADCRAFLGLAGGLAQRGACRRGGSNTDDAHSARRGDLRREQFLRPLFRDLSGGDESRQASRHSLPLPARPPSTASARRSRISSRSIPITTTAATRRPTGSTAATPSPATTTTPMTPSRKRTTMASPTSFRLTPARSRRRKTRRPSRPAMPISPWAITTATP